MDYATDVVYAIRANGNMLREIMKLKNNQEIDILLTHASFCFFPREWSCCYHLYFTTLRRRRAEVGTHLVSSKDCSLRQLIRDLRPCAPFFRLRNPD